MGDPDRCCDVCDEAVGETPWLLLNRYGVGTGGAHGMFTVLTHDDEYLWDQEDDEASGVLLHRGCIELWLDMKMAEIDYEVDAEVQ